jgi:hypothetical protein
MIHYSVYITWVILASPSPTSPLSSTSHIDIQSTKHYPDALQFLLHLQHGQSYNLPARTPSPCSTHYGNWSSTACAARTLEERMVPVRTAPYVDPKVNITKSKSEIWMAPSLDFYTGTWYFTNGSLASFLSYRNLQWDLWPSIPTCLDNSTACPPGTRAGEVVDVTTWLLDPPKDGSRPTADFGARAAGGRPLSSIYSIDVPHRMRYPQLGPAWEGAFWNLGTDGSVVGYAQEWAIIYWGSDARGLPFMVIHEADGYLGGKSIKPICLDVFSRSPDGPDAESLTIVLDALKQLGDLEMNDMIDGLQPASRDPTLPVGAHLCPASCVKNGAK